MDLNIYFDFELFCPINFFFCYIACLIFSCMRRRQYFKRVQQQQPLAMYDFTYKRATPEIWSQMINSNLQRLQISEVFLNVIIKSVLTILNQIKTTRFWHIIPKKSFLLILVWRDFRLRYEIFAVFYSKTLEIWKKKPRIWIFPYKDLNSKFNSNLRSSNFRGHCIIEQRTSAYTLCFK